MTFALSLLSGLVGTFANLEAGVSLLCCSMYFLLRPYHYSYGIVLYVIHIRCHNWNFCPWGQIPQVSPIECVW